MAYAIVVRSRTNEYKAVDRATTIFEARAIARRISIHRPCQIKHVTWSYATWEQYRTLEHWYEGRRSNKAF